MKGQLVRSIMYPKPVDFRFTKDLFKFVGFLGCISGCGFIYTIIIMVLRGSTLRRVIVRALDIITITVPPALPAAMSVGIINAQLRLKNKEIYCISPSTINTCGAINVVCFDKTGTLTEDGLDFHVLRGVNEPSSSKDPSFTTDARIRTIMVTGDNLLTAMSVARECGIIRPNKRAFLVEHCPGEVDLRGRTKIVVKQSVSSSGDILDDESIMPKSLKDAELGELIQSSYHLAISDLIYFIFIFSVCYRLRWHACYSGPTFAVVTHEYPELIDSLVTVCDVFARMAPDQKQQLINCLQEVNYTVAMCGDGANDCAALKAAHAGISLSDSEASIAAPFTSKVADIRCVPTIISEGRAALVTSFGIFKYMAGYSLTQFVTVMLLYYISNILTDGQFMYIDMFLITLLAVLFGNTSAYENLCPTPPPTRLLSIASICSVLGQLAIMGTTQVSNVLLIS
ncbi:haloacid dehalogenase-like hydrolase [Oesophagostomum dentatum]|uniref:Haloacid dehalogenase-like hydrolase n=1 Tax=Oesophagostomum dentatum TaxID=61180 RepID=A0A0B1TBA5_OESDE|nr:haloacid dehalogenase-like hydrolase [Oesophagostomum dentatum]